MQGVIKIKHSRMASQQQAASSSSPREKQRVFMMLRGGMRRIFFVVFLSDVDQPCIQYKSYAFSISVMSTFPPQTQKSPTRKHTQTTARATAEES